MNKAAFQESFKVYEQQVASRKKWLEDYAVTCDAVKISIQNAKKDAQNINAAALDDHSLKRAQELVRTAWISTDIDPLLLNSFEEEFSILKTTAKEQSRQKRFRDLVQKCEKSLQKAKENSKEYQPSLLDNSSLAMIDPKSETETQEKKRIEKEYAFISSERIRQDRINEFARISSEVASSIDNATSDPNSSKPELLDLNLLKRLEKQAVSDDEKKIVAKYEFDFKSIHDSFLKQEFVTAMEKAKSSIVKTRTNSEIPDSSQLDSLSLQRAEELLLEHRELLSSFQTALDKLKEDFSSTLEKERKHIYTTSIDQAELSCEKAKESADNLDESQLDYTALDTAQDHAKSSEEHLAAENCRLAFEAIKTDAFEQRKKNLETFIASRKQALESILADSLMTDEVKVTEIEKIKKELLLEAEKIKSNAMKGCKTDKEMRGRATALFAEVNDVLRSYRKNHSATTYE